MKHALLLVCLWLPCAARAQTGADLERAKASFKAGAAAYGLGDYPAAIQALDSAYAITPLPAIAFSLAQAERRQYFATHEREHLERALSLFRTYLAQVGTAGRRADALDALAQLEPLALGGFASSGPAREQPKRTRLMISAEPQSARVSIDGTEASTAPLIREVTPGKHQVRVEAEGYQPATSEVTALEGELILDELQLRELPGELALSTPEGALVYVDGRFAAFGGPRVRLSLPQGSYRLSVAAWGHQTAERRVLIERAQTASADVALAPTRQRSAARVLGALGGASAATSVILAGLSLRSQHRAQDFLHDSTRANVSAQALSRYNDQVDTRDNLRTASIAAASASAALLIATVLLHQLDRPRVERLQTTALVQASGLALAVRY
ncbi:MAG TPA: PEGA domain-containing protein [Polyangiales bacterium]|nr:PEGA domain-containing protein [Polyangiales bacterium]